MKGFLFVLGFMLMAVGVFGQAEPSDTSQAEQLVDSFVYEQQSEFPGGDQELHKFLRENIRYPKEDKKRKIQGTVYVQFVIDKTGTVTDVQIYPGTESKSTPAMQAEAIRVIQAMPKWKPGTQR